MKASARKLIHGLGEIISAPVRGYQLLIGIIHFAFLPVKQLFGKRKDAIEE